MITKDLLQTQNNQYFYNPMLIAPKMINKPAPSFKGNLSDDELNKEETLKIKSLADSAIGIAGLSLNKSNRRKTNHEKLARDIEREFIQGTIPSTIPKKLNISNFLYYYIINEYANSVDRNEFIRMVEKHASQEEVQKKLKITKEQYKRLLNDLKNNTQEDFLQADDPVLLELRKQSNLIKTDNKHYDLAQKIERQLNQGFTPKQIAADLGISDSTYHKVVNKFANSVDRNEFMKMVNDNMSRIEIQRKLNISIEQYKRLLLELKSSNEKNFLDNAAKDLNLLEIKEHNSFNK